MVSASRSLACVWYYLSCRVWPRGLLYAADRVNFLYTARVMSQAYPWIAQEAGLYRKYDLDVPLVFVTPGAPSAAAILSGDSEVAQIGAATITRPFVQGNKDLVFIGGIKSLLTHSIIAKPDIKTPAQLKGKRIGVSRIGSNPHYFAVQALRQFRHRLARGQLPSGRRRARNSGGAGGARNRRRGFDGAHRRPSADAWAITTSSTAPI